MPHRAIGVTAGCQSGQHCTGPCIDWTEYSQHPQHCTACTRILKVCMAHLPKCFISWKKVEAKRPWSAWTTYKHIMNVASVWMSLIMTRHYCIEKQIYYDLTSSCKLKPGIKACLQKEWQDQVCLEGRGYFIIAKQFINSILPPNLFIWGGRVLS